MDWLMELCPDVFFMHVWWSILVFFVLHFSWVPTRFCNLDSRTSVPQTTCVLCVTTGAACEWIGRLMDNFFVSDCQLRILLPTYYLGCFSDKCLACFHYTSIYCPKWSVLAYFFVQGFTILHCSSFLSIHHSPCQDFTPRILQKFQSSSFCGFRLRFCRRFLLL